MASSPTERVTNALARITSLAEVENIQNSAQDIIDCLHNEVESLAMEDGCNGLKNASVFVEQLKALPVNFEQLILDRSRAQDDPASKPKHHKADSQGTVIRRNLNWFASNKGNGAQRSWVLPLILLYGLFGDAALSLGFLKQLRKLATSVPVWAEAWAKLKVKKITAHEERGAGRPTQDGKWHTWMIAQIVESTDRADPEIKSGPDIELSRREPEQVVVPVDHSPVTPLLPLMARKRRHHRDDDETLQVSPITRYQLRHKIPRIESSHSSPRSQVSELEGMEFPFDLGGSLSVPSSPSQDSAILEDAQSLRASPLPQLSQPLEGGEQIARNHATELAQHQSPKPRTADTQIIISSGPASPRLTTPKVSTTANEISLNPEQKQPGEVLSLRECAARRFEASGLLNDICIDTVLFALGPDMRNHHIISSGYMEQDHHAHSSLKLDNRNLLVVPVNINYNHWNGAIMDRQAKTIELFDPYMNQENRQQCFFRIKQRFRQLIPDVAAYEISEPAEIPSTFYQPPDDSTNCGIYVLVYLLCRIHGISVPRTLDISIWRQGLSHLFSPSDAVSMDDNYDRPTSEDVSGQQLTRKINDFENCLRNLSLVRILAGIAMRSYASMVAENQQCIRTIEKIDVLISSLENLQPKACHTMVLPPGDQIQAQRTKLLDIEREERIRLDNLQKSLLKKIKSKEATDVLGTLTQALNKVAGYAVCAESFYIERLAQLQRQKDVKSEQERIQEAMENLEKSREALLTKQAKVQIKGSW